MQAPFWAVLGLALAGQPVFAQEAQPTTSVARRLQGHVAVAALTVPYCVDLLWQVPFGSRLGRLTTTVANPDLLQAPGRVFLVRGTGTVFSPGFGDLCTTLRQAGLWAEDLGPAGHHWLCQQLLNDQRTGQRHSPIVLVGHSRGGRHVLDAAAELQKAGILVDLLVCLDTAQPPLVPSNVRHAVHVYRSQQLLYPTDRLRAAVGAHGRIDNHDLDNPSCPLHGHRLHHLNITAAPAVHAWIVNSILQIVHQRTRTIQTFGSP